MKPCIPVNTDITLKALGLIASASALAAPVAASAQDTCSISPAMQSAPITDSARTFTANCTTPPKWYTWEVLDQMNGIRQGASIANPEGRTSFSFTPVSHLGEGTYTIKLSADLSAPGLPSAYQDFRATLVVATPATGTPDPQPPTPCLVSPASACQQPPQPVCKITPATQVTPVGNTARRFSVSCSTAFYSHGWMLTDSNNVATGVTSPPGAAMQSEFTTPGNLAAGTYMIDFSASFEQTTSIPNVRPVDRAVLVVAGAGAGVQTWPPAPPAKGYRVEGRINGYASSRLKMLDTANGKSYFCDVRGTHYSCAFEDHSRVAGKTLTPVGMVSKTKQDGSAAFTEDKAIVFDPAVAYATCNFVRLQGTMSPLVHFCGDGIRYGGPSLVVRGGAFSFDDKSEAILNCAEELLKDILPEPQVTSTAPDMRVRRYSSDWAIGIVPAQGNQGNFVFASPGVKWFTTLASIDSVNSNFCGLWRQ